MDEKIDPNKVYVAGRVGDLADYTNPLTFSLVKKIFGHGGPYRSVLSQFHIGNPNDKRDFLVYLHGRVYSDIKIENEVLWKSIGMNLKPTKDSVKQQKFISFQSIKTIPNSIRKLKKEINILKTPHKYIDAAAEKYAKLSKSLEYHYRQQSITVREFLTLYEDVVFISYLYELASTYQGTDSLSLELQDYLQKNDYLVNSKHVTEKSYLKQGFDLNISIDDLQQEQYPKFIPTRLPPLPNNVASKEKMFVQTQCMKNNARLKTNVLVYLLAKTLKKRTYAELSESLYYLTIDEILSKNDEKSLRKIAQKRKVSLEKVSKELPSIIKNGSIDTSENIEKKYEGTPCSTGEAEGKVQIITKASDPIRSDILFFPNASPEFTLLYPQAKGILFKVGSKLSHGAIVAREYRIPAVIIDLPVSNIEGKKIKLNGTSGVIKIIDD